MLADLPFELLAHIVAHLSTARAVRALSLTCRTLKEFVDQEAWRIFTHSRFPSISTPGLWKEAAHVLTTLSRNWDRRSLVARYLEPNGAITTLPTGNQIQRWKRPQGQSMGYQPRIESFTEWIGPKWIDQKELLAWSAGTELVLRIQQTTQRAARQWRRAASDSHRLFCQNRWFTFKSPDTSEGRDDITSLKLLRPWQCDVESVIGEVQHVILGRANGDLRRLEFNLTSPSAPYQQVYATRRQSVLSIDVSPSSSPLLASCLGDSRVTLYNVYNDKTFNEPISETTLSNSQPNSRLWSTKFLSDTCLAVGTGPSRNPLSIYDVTPTGIRQYSTRKLDQLSLEYSAECTWPSSTSVYAVTPLPSSSVASALPGEVFLSGAFDGRIRLHDLRSPNAAEQSYFDGADESAIYSLATVGRERLAAGTARHSMVKFFDLRVDGGRVYHYIDALAQERKNRNDKLRSSDVIARFTDEATESGFKNLDGGAGWNLFLNPREMHAAPGRGHSTWSSRRAVESPVYSLSMPSTYSPTLFAGVENALVQLDFASVLDRHPDPTHATSMKFDATGDVDIRQTWNRKSDVLNLGMYEQMNGINAETLRLKVQKSLQSKDWEVRPNGLDERWRDSSEL
ncbi:hypothetical protein EV356DRAFT_509237 [Viridothelium virens]|uniref:F-box domain-containing protein n=1 Tax=Viridothelium virens TaxID=1048519 RepID=A0A6A6GXG7_VIRVR|nr:hypothetical protein EV356DRAFT_509237 [Viridothelium virens]